MQSFVSGLHLYCPISQIKPLVSLAQRQNSRLLAGWSLRHCWRKRKCLVCENCIRETLWNGLIKGH
jgi:hypothetical protein